MTRQQDHSRLPNRLAFWFRCLATFIAAAALVRLVLTLWVAQETPDDILPFLAAWAVGLADDTATAVLLGLPFLAGLYILARPLRWRAIGGARSARRSFQG